ncbi:MAG TPA: hypothetical protein VGB78_03615 [Thermoplasmata archaeon]
MATEFELSASGSSRDLLDAISLLAENNISLETIATAKIGDRYIMKFLTASEEECRRTFIKADLRFKERKVLVLEVSNRPGQWVKAAKCLAENGVDLQASYLLRQEGNKVRFVFVVDDYDKARDIARKKCECTTD